MRIKNIDIIQALNGLMEIENKEMPVSLAYRFNQCNMILTENYKVYLKTLEPIKENEEKVMELLELKSEINLKKIKMSQLDDAGLTLSPKVLAQLAPILEVSDG